jgi:DNA-3-methyladenine glycosylase II
MSTPEYRKARRHLSRKCDRMKSLIGRVGPCMLVPKPDEPFTLIISCVISQQISTKAAASIFARLAEAQGGTPLKREKLARMTEAKFKACGISGPKQRTLRAVMDHVKANPDLLPGIHERDDDLIREQLTAIKGIGPWTVDMLLMFGFARPDVLPVGDYGVKVAAKNLFGLDALPDAKTLTELAEPWRPFRTVASWYLWRSLEGTAVLPS